MSHITQWTVPVDHPAFAGHFPGAPILPGVVLLDIALQNIAKMNNMTLETCEISSVKFLSPVNPGDVLTVEHKTSSNGTLHFDIAVDTRKVATGAIALNLQALNPAL